MTAPRHLWSGDWQDESSAHGEELAARRARAGQPAEAEPAPASPRSAPSAADRLRGWLRAARQRLRRRPRRPRRRTAGTRRARAAVLVGLMVLVIGGAAYAATSAIVGTGASNQTAASGYQPWLGVDMYNSPFGGPIVVAVVPGSPAQAGGVQPGDVISQVDGQPVATVSGFASALAGKHAGDQVVLELERGSVTYVAHVTLATRPVANP
jgi:hypothetical protein